MRGDISILWLLSARHVDEHHASILRTRSCDIAFVSFRIDPIRESRSSSAFNGPTTTIELSLTTQPDRSVRWIFLSLSLSPSLSLSLSLRLPGISSSTRRVGDEITRDAVCETPRGSFVSQVDANLDHNFGRAIVFCHRVHVMRRRSRNFDNDGKLSIPRETRFKDRSFRFRNDSELILFYFENWIQTSH